ncbi:type I-E CRISPR-associated endonuclease Cas1e [Verminephrobacter aporrectodeae]|uniref:CRISPR-associated endonuclease Cas1 n=3 Tax=Verminephrobacter TaxID=364316 RepID=A0ABT3KXD8_9BURK|nr:type I-E CRISPR-associated endonuclease Cas1e [Verminephrobacter aporrectodeae]MCW5221590.1 type I-E CRISPR-associated endonuclease Cas1 [Verminephrobacter aporrectodeae subsp. tuberculatae]MCW5290880.1 type I-E CRISPR-associated endonuclease Cas1 [Verminephrobacter aporrectodeae subsp. tuberculatae]MCW5322960.1 type I-E CRISPR-associated endonuclease Cas1 [Verminephrobacter aporrectodeae subsp. tuberculatae]MCW8176682.1 type I-E CRISPR-associated endonuclease Cas1 [Verminephrobacter aporrec
MLKGRLGLETARIPHADRHGLLWLSRGELCVVDGCLHFLRGRNSLTPLMDQIPHQAVSTILLGPGSSVTHDALRLLARHGTLLAAVGEDGVRSYTALPLLPDRSDVARRQAELWSNPRRRISVARQMYALRLGEVLPHRDLDTLRGIEGSRVKNFYRLMAEKHGISWKGRNYDRAHPDATDLPNQAINHAATAVQAAAAIAVQSLAALPPLGFIHENSGQSFVLDIADLFRDTVTLQIAFTAARRAQQVGDTIDKLVRREATAVFRKQQLIGAMIDRIKQVLRMDEASHGAGDDRDA